MNVNDCCHIYKRFTRYEETRALREANAVFNKRPNIIIWPFVYVGATLLVTWLLTR